jgi:hypothetical protein
MSFADQLKHESSSKGHLYVSKFTLKRKESLKSILRLELKRINIHHVLRGGFKEDVGLHVESE